MDWTFYCHISEHRTFGGVIERDTPVVSYGWVSTFSGKTSISAGVLTCFENLIYHISTCFIYIYIYIYIYSARLFKQHASPVSKKTWLKFLPSWSLLDFVPIYDLIHPNLRRRQLGPSTLERNSCWRTGRWVNDVNHITLKNWSSIRAAIGARYEKPCNIIQGDFLITLRFKRVS